MEEQYQQVLNRIESARQKSPFGQKVSLLAVSKMQSVEKISKLYQLGQRDFGENYVQELVEKAKLVSDRLPGVRWHMIGHVQTNKVKDLLPWVDSIHSVDSVKLAREISKRLQPGKKVKIFVQVNIDEESSKSGLPMLEVKKVVQSIAEFSNLELLGLMCIPSPEKKSEAESSYVRLRNLEKSCQPYTRGELSMGMSQDYVQAIHEGATWVRIGSEIFGQRKNK